MLSVDFHDLSTFTLFSYYITGHCFPKLLDWLLLSIKPINISGFTGLCPQPFSPYTHSSWVVSSSAMVSNAIHVSVMYFPAYTTHWRLSSFIQFLCGIFITIPSGISNLTGPRCNWTFHIHIYLFVHSHPGPLPNLIIMSLLHTHIQLSKICSKSHCCWPPLLHPSAKRWHLSQDQGRSLRTVALSMKYF